MPTSAKVLADKYKDLFDRVLEISLETYELRYAHLTHGEQIALASYLPLLEDSLNAAKAAFTWFIFYFNQLAANGKTNDDR